MPGLGIVLAGALLLATIGMLLPAGADALDCKPVRGHLDEVPLEACASPVGLCTVARMSGSIHGDAIFTAATITVSANVALTGVVFVTGDTVVEDAKLAGHRGTVAIQNDASFRTTGDNALADVQTIVGGSGDFAGATGSLRISGDFVPGVGGSSTYEGEVCFQ